MDIKTTTLLSLLAGVGGTGLGGIYNFFIKQINIAQMNSILSFAGGIMLTAVFMELIPEAIQISGLAYTMLGIIIGIMFILATDIFLEKVMTEKQQYARSAIVLFLAIAAHNFPEGMAIGSGFEASSQVGLILVITLAIHNIPEGMAIATSFRLSGMGPFKAFISTMIAGTPMALGSIVGHKLGHISPILITISLGFAAGAMIYTVCDEILPDTFEVGQSSPWGFILGLITGVLLFNIL